MSNFCYAIVILIITRILLKHNTRVTALDKTDLAPCPMSILNTTRPCHTRIPKLNIVYLISI